VARNYQVFQLIAFQFQKVVVLVDCNLRVRQEVNKGEQKYKKVIFYHAGLLQRFSNPNTQLTVNWFWC
jgi:hypothetical protein